MTVTVTPTVDMASTPPRVQLNVAASAGETQTTITRLDPDGVLRPVRTTTGSPLPFSGGTALAYDYEVPYGAPVSYSSLESPGTVSAQVTVDESRVWLIHPGVPVLSRPVVVSDFAERKRAAQRGVFYPMGRAMPVVQTDGQRKSAEYSLSLYTGTDADSAALETLLDDTTPLLLNVPATKGWGLGAEYVSVGDVTESRVVRFPGEQARVWSLALTVVDPPIGGSQSARTYTDLLVFGSYAEMQSAYPTYAALLAGP